MSNVFTPVLLLYTALARNDINIKDGGWRV